MLRFQAEERWKELSDCHPLCAGQHQLQDIQGTRWVSVWSFSLHVWGYLGFHSLSSQHSQRFASQLSDPIKKKTKKNNLSAQGLMYTTAFYEFPCWIMVPWGARCWMSRCSGRVLGKHTVHHTLVLPLYPQSLINPHASAVCLWML